MWDVVVIGGGIAGLTAAHALREQAVESGREIRVCVVEREARLGGKVLSDRAGGFVVEGGPDSFIVQKPWALELVRELGLDDRIVAANAVKRTTYVLKSGRLVPLPEGLQLLVPQRWGPFLRSPFLSPGAKLRVALERWISPRRKTGDESVAAFVRRRFGNEVLEGLAEPLLAHIHVADVERMSLAATYPRLAEMEARFGSLTRGLRSLPRTASRAPVVRGETGRGGPVFLTLRGGLGELIRRLEEQLPPEVRYQGRTARRLTRTGAGDYLVRLDDGTALETQALVLAVPAFAAAGLLEPFDAELGSRLRAIRYVSMATVSLGYRRSEVGHPLAGFGFFVPRREKRAILACTWTSSKFEGRTPDDEHVLIRVFLGGALQEDVLAEADPALLGLVRRELGEILGIHAAPVLERLYRWPRGYPQYEVGHLGRVRAIEESLPPGIAVAGSAYYGVGLPDCIQSARQASNRVLARLRERVAEVDGGALAC